MNTEIYRNNEILSASPIELIIMLYDEGVNALKRAEAAFDINDDKERIEAIHTHTLRAQNVITELACALDMEKGGEIAKNLDRLYDFMLNHLTTANVDKTRKPVSEVLQILADLRNTWVQAKENMPAAEKQPSAMPIGNVGNLSFSA